MAHYETPEIDACIDCSSELYTVTRRLVPLFSNSERQIYETVNYVVLFGVVSIFGVVTNIINIMVFYKQGFTSTVNISFFALAISDLFSLIFAMWFGVTVNPLLEYSDIEIFFPDLSYLTAGMPHICLARITGWTTVFITAERCLCITLPLKIKQIVTPRRTTIIIVAIYIVIISTFVPEFATSYYGWTFIKTKNRTLVGLIFTSDHAKVDGLAFCLYSTLGFASFIAVVIFTLVLVVQLNRKTKWRMQATLGQDQSNTTANREKKTIKMVVAISIVLIVCYTPGVMVSMVASVVTEFGMFGVYVNAFYVLWSFVFVMETINSSINIFFYYRMSMKYRDTFRLLFACWFQDSINK